MLWRFEDLQLHVIGQPLTSGTATSKLRSMPRYRTGKPSFRTICSMPSSVDLHEQPEISFSIALQWSGGGCHATACHGKEVFRQKTVSPIVIQLRPVYVNRWLLRVAQRPVVHPVGEGPSPPALAFKSDYLLDCNRVLISRVPQVRTGHLRCGERARV